MTACVVGFGYVGLPVATHLATLVDVVPLSGSVLRSEPLTADRAAGGDLELLCRRASRVLDTRGSCR